MVQKKEQRWSGEATVVDVATIEMSVVATVLMDEEWKANNCKYETTAKL